MSYRKSQSAVRRAAVETLETRRLLATFTVNTVADDVNPDANLTLREAIQVVNGTLTLLTAGELALIDQSQPLGTNDTINFNIGAGGLATIGLTSDLPNIVKPLTIDGYTQGGSKANTLAVGDDAVINIQIDGNDFAIFNLKLGSGGSTIRGLAMYQSGENGIALESPNNVIAGNFIGLLADGTTGGATEQIANAGVTIDDVAGNRIGGTAPADRNIIANGQHGGINIDSGGGVGLASFNHIEGNYIGTDRTGLLARPNLGWGVTIDTNANDNVIGGTTAAHRNVISGNLDGSGPDAGIYIIGGSTRNVVQGNYIGVDATGMLGLGNGGSGIRNFGPANIIGGDVAGAGNVISGNDEPGIELIGSRAVQNIIKGNFIGMNALGTAAIRNGKGGIHISNEASKNQIGGTSALARNLISGNNDSGVLIDDEATENRVQGNYIGTDVTGMLPFPNDDDGVRVGAEDNFVGGDVAGAGNLISGNGSNGVRVLNVNRSTVQGNLIGTNALGTGAVPNAEDGILFEEAGGAPNLFGGTTPGARNVISGNLGNGINADSGNCFIRGNYIGTDITGTLPLGNGEDGIHVSGSFATIGGPIPAAGNVIAFNAKDGVVVTGGCRSLIRLNSIHSNGELGIDLQNDGVTGNDVGDTDGDIGVFRPNDLQNFPALALAQSGGGGTTVQGGFNSKPNQLYLIDFYANDAFDPSLYGEGKTYLGSVAVTTDSNGNATYNTTFSTVVPAGKYISATATTTEGHDPEGGTSEFSQVIQVLAPPPPPAPSISINDVTKSEGNSGTTNFTFTLTRSSDLSASSIVSCSTAAGSALSPDDFTSQTGVQVTFAPNQATASFTVGVKGDGTFEADENFFVNVASVSNATISDGQGQGTIQNDDAQVVSVALVPDPTNASKYCLKIDGTDNADKIDLLDGKHGDVTVKINGTSKGTFHFNGCLYICSGGGNDCITIDSKVAQYAYVFAGVGNDIVSSGGGNSLFVGGLGDDKLTGGGKRDIVIGGDGQDNLDGGSEDDIVVSGFTNFDGSLADLLKIQKEWTRTDKNYQIRVSNIRSGAGLNTGVKFSETTIFADNYTDVVKGSGGNDAFFATNSSGTGRKKDSFSDKGSSETLVDCTQLA